jgi:hypothetical protein
MAGVGNFVLGNLSILIGQQRDDGKGAPGILKFGRAERRDALIIASLSQGVAEMEQHKIWPAFRGLLRPVLAALDV